MKLKENIPATYFIAKQVFTIILLVSRFLAIGWVVKELIVEQP